MSRTHAPLIDEAIVIERRMKDDKKRLDEIKSKLTTQAVEQMDNKNLKYVQFFGSAGKFNVSYKEKFEIDRFSVLERVLGDLAEGKIAKKVDVKYEVDAKLKAALIALFKGEFSNVSPPSFVLNGLGLDSKTMKAVEKKLKGDYLSDKKLLESVGATGDLEEELDAIRMYKQWELVDRFFGDLTAEQLEELKRAIFVEDNLAVGFDYEK